MQNNYHLESEKSPDIRLPVEANDAKYVSGMSTILVATLQEAKDRISQVEYIFCSQLYPNYQKSSKCVQTLYSEARIAAEEEWKVRVSDLENQLNDVCVVKERALEECNAVKMEKLKLIERVAELEEMLVAKTNEIDEGSRLHTKLLGVIESKSAIVVSKEKQMKEQEEKMSALLGKFREQEEKIIALTKNLQEKDEEVNKGKMSAQELIRQIDTQMLNISSCEQRLSKSEEEKIQLAAQLKAMEAMFSCLQNELRSKTTEAKHLQEQFVQQVNRNESDLVKKDQLLRACEKEKLVLLSKISHSENKIRGCQESLTNGISLMPNVNVWAKQLEFKCSELSIETQRRKDAIAAYKNLKSQQNFLLKKLGLTSEEMLLQMKAGEESDQNSNDNRTSKPPEVSMKNPVSDVFAAQLSKVKNEVDSMETSDDEISGRLNQMSNSRSPPSSTSPAAMNQTTKKLGSAGTKRPASGWRETRSRQSPGGADPHDDFLDTPCDNIRGNLLKAVQGNQHGAPTSNLKGADSDSSDDETQDMNPKPGPDRQPAKTPRIGPKDFKYVEPVRKKAERENLNGIECKQCKKFYDAVHCDDKGTDVQMKQQNLRCEHHDGVSRHRYKYIPPMTPEGFWNIGFDTES